MEESKEEDETPIDAVNRPLKDRVEAALTKHCNFIAKLQHEKQLFPNQESFQKGVVDKLNKICTDYGVRKFFSHNGFTGTYCSVKCSHCKHSALLWFVYTKNSKGEATKISFKRPPYGTLMHKDIAAHSK